MTRKQLIEQIKQKRSFLCVGLDTDITKIPGHLQAHPDAVFEFNRQIIDATKDLCVSYKLNTAFYEAMGLKGWEAMERTVNYIPQEHFIIADAKDGDMGFGTPAPGPRPGIARPHLLKEGRGEIGAVGLRRRLRDHRRGVLHHRLQHPHAAFQSARRPV